eukprot:7381091-Prymnesium_polylepis.2
MPFRSKESLHHLQPCDREETGTRGAYGWTSERLGGHSHRFCGFIEIRSVRKPMQTRRQTTTLACSNFSEINKIQPRLPQEAGGCIVVVEECCRAAQRGRNAAEQRTATSPQQGDIEQRDADGPHSDHDNGQLARPVVPVRGARHRKIRVQVAANVSIAVLDPVAQKCFEDPRGGAGHEQEGQSQRQRKNGLKPDEHCSASASRRSQRGFGPTPISSELQAHRAHGEDQQKCNRPRRANP